MSNQGPSGRRRRDLTATGQSTSSHNQRRRLGLETTTGEVRGRTQFKVGELPHYLNWRLAAENRQKKRAAAAENNPSQGPVLTPEQIKTLVDQALKEPSTEKSEDCQSTPPKPKP